MPDRMLGALQAWRYARPARRRPVRPPTRPPSTTSCRAWAWGRSSCLSSSYRAKILILLVHSAGSRAVCPVHSPLCSGQTSFFFGSRTAATMRTLLNAMT